jgi:hypothetical protein
MMKRIGTLMKSFGLLLSLCVISNAGATPPSGVNIEAETSFLGTLGPFVASGPAVDNGLICDKGEVIDYSGKVTGFSPNGFNFQGIKHFICDDGSGEFLVNVQARIDLSGGATFNWNVLGGIGDYEDLHGAGSGVGLPICGPDCVFDVYDGGLHID